MSIALLNIVVLWDGIKVNESTGDLALNISGKKTYFLLCAICEMSVIAVTLSHIFPAANSVARLSLRWTVLYAENNTMVIKSLQDSGNCCGLASLTDKAWPFENSSAACHEIYKRQASCLSSWLESHNLAAVMIIVVVSITLIFKGILIVISICFRKTTILVLETNDNISILDKELESGLYDVKVASTTGASTTTREANISQYRNTLVNRF